MRLVLISDTHGKLNRINVPDGDVLIHAGDFSLRGSYREIADELAVMALLPHKQKVAVAGNHDFAFVPNPNKLDGSPSDYCMMLGIKYLQDRAVTINGLNFYGSPWQPWFHDWAFNLPRGQALADKWAMIPTDTDILITHGPPSGYGSLNYDDEEVGDDDLRDAIINDVRPVLHVAGHIHEGYGKRHHPLLDITFVNASNCDLLYNPVNAPIVIDL